MVGGEAQIRKARSVAILRQEGIPVNDHLPVIETAETSIRRSATEVVERAVALTICAVKGEGHNEEDPMSPEELARFIADFDAHSFFTPEEQAFISDNAPSEQTTINFTWRYECLHVLLWSLGFLDDLGHPGSITDVPEIVGIIVDRNTDNLLRDAKLRPQSQILNEADLIYRYHWAVRDAQINGAPIPHQLDPGVVMERHHALNWLVGYRDQDWDDISTDT